MPFESREFYDILEPGERGQGLSDKAGGGSKNPDFRRTSLIDGPLFVNMYLLLSFKVFAFSNQRQRTQWTKKHPKKLGIPDGGSQVHGGHGPEMS